VFELFGMGPADLLMKIPELLFIRVGLNEVQKEYPVIYIPGSHARRREHFRRV